MPSSRASDIVRERLSPALAERLAHLDAVRASRSRDRELTAPDAQARFDVDVVFAGGGLSLLVAAELASLGVSVVVLERTRAGAAHREWNASAGELEPLVSSGIVTKEELGELVVARYQEGLCTFHGGTPRRVRDVLDHAVDAGPLLARVRDVAASRGVRFIDGAAVSGIGAGEHGVRVAFRDANASPGSRTDGETELVAKLVVDARGASSPWATADLVCPTVGGVLRGLREGAGPREVDAAVGEILVTTEGAEAGRQYVWEGFPGRPGEVTVYIFYYALAGEVPGGALTDLYERFFDKLASYKEGPAELVRPTFGYIPGWSRLTRPPLPPSPRIVLVGDAAARHSPLTFCGFGSMLRSFQPAAAVIASAIADGKAPPSRLLDDEPVHAWTGALARVMASGKLDGDKLNVLLDAAFGALEEMGNDRFVDLLKDRMTGPDFTEFLRRTARLRPVVYGDVMRALGPAGAFRWGARLARQVFG